MLKKYLLAPGPTPVPPEVLLAMAQPMVQLKQQGAHLFACAYAAQRRRHPITDQANFCGLVVLSDLIKGCDRFIALN